MVENGLENKQHFIITLLPTGDKFLVHRNVFFHYNQMLYSV